jgi:ribonuclease HI
MAKVYAVKKGLIPGIYDSWNEAEKQVKGFPGAEFKSFKAREEALLYLNDEVSSIEESFDDTISIYTDGSYNESKGFFGGAFIVVVNGEVIHQDSYESNDVNFAAERNNAGELGAVMRAALWAQKMGHKKIVVYHDYLGVACFISGQWKAKSAGSKAYADFMSIKIKIDIEFRHVKGHSGNKFNDIVDKLAYSSCH